MKGRLAWMNDPENRDLVRFFGAFVFLLLMLRVI